MISCGLTFRRNSILHPSPPPGECEAWTRLFFFGPLIFSCTRFYSLDHAAISKVCEFCNSYFPKSHSRARGRALPLLPSFPLHTGSPAAMQQPTHCGSAADLSSFGFVPSKTFLKPSTLLSRRAPRLHPRGGSSSEIRK